MTFTFVDLFAGIGGFHVALERLGGTAVFASEIDRHAQEVYRHNFGHRMSGEIVGDIIPLTESSVDPVIPSHDILVGGFPCQPFSKSGFQRGIGETRGTLFYNIASIMEARRPRVVVLENVRNLIGPNHRHTWYLIRRTLRDLGYRTPEQPTVFSPHLLSRGHLGAPQVRERVFIVGVYVGRDEAWRDTDDSVLMPNGPVRGWHPRHWSLEQDVLQADSDIADLASHRLTDAEVALVDMWEDFLGAVGADTGNRLPGHPLWADYFTTDPAFGEWPDWKIDFVTKNAAFYRSNKRAIDAWRRRHSNLAAVPESRRKLEWQAQDMGSIWDGLIQFRPSGLRVKKPNYVPALVAMNQTSVFGPRRRRLTVREAARLQGFPDDFSFASQPAARSFKQLGNAVSVGVVTQVLSQAAFLWDFFPDDIAKAIRAARIQVGLPDAPLDFGLGEDGS